MTKKYKCKIDFIIESEDIENTLINMAERFAEIKKEIAVDDRINYYDIGIQINEL